MALAIFQTAQSSTRCHARLWPESDLSQPLQSFQMLTLCSATPLVMDWQSEIRECCHLFQNWDPSQIDPAAQTNLESEPATLAEFSWRHKAMQVLQDRSCHICMCNPRQDLLHFYQNLISQIPPHEPHPKALMHHGFGPDL